MDKQDREFVAERYDNSTLFLKDVNAPKDVPICTINKNEILFNKGGVKIGNVGQVFCNKEKNDEVRLIIDLPEDKKWNSAVKKRHPIRWKLGLIGKSTPSSLSIGFTKDKTTVQEILSFFNEIGVDCTENKSPTYELIYLNS